MAVERLECAQRAAGRVRREGPKLRAAIEKMLDDHEAAMRQSSCLVLNKQRIKENDLCQFLMFARSWSGGLAALSNSADDLVWAAHAVLKISPTAYGGTYCQRKHLLTMFHRWLNCYPELLILGRPDTQLPDAAPGVQLPPDVAAAHAGA